MEKENVKRELQDVRDVAMTGDGWTSVSQDYLTVSLCVRKILHKRAVYTFQAGDVVAAEIGDILDEFMEHVVAITLENAAGSKKNLAVNK